MGIVLLDIQGQLTSQLLNVAENQTNLSFYRDPCTKYVRKVRGHV